MTHTLTTTNERIRRIGEIKVSPRGTNMTTTAYPGPKIINLQALKGEKVDVSVFQRGVNLRAQGRVRANDLYPWRYTVSGDDHATGTTLYIVDLSAYECSCLYFTNTGRTCKHIVGALLDYWEKNVETD